MNHLRLARELEPGDVVHIDDAPGSGTSHTGVVLRTRTDPPLTMLTLANAPAGRSPVWLPADAPVELEDA